MTKHLSAAVRIQKARTALLLDHPFFGSLLFRLGGRPSKSIQTMATDGVSLYYNPAFVETLNAAELAGVLAHEVMHPALQHHTRRGDRDQKCWNMACDYAINPLLLDAGLAMHSCIAARCLLLLPGILSPAISCGERAKAAYSGRLEQRSDD